MVLNCIINGIEFKDVIPQGSTYIDEYNEVLDSGIIMLGQVTKLNAKPGDIVYIFNEGKTYEKYFAIDEFDGERVNIDEKLWNYTIKLCSETKLLEKIPCPNLNITSGKERTIWDYLTIYVNFYSPKIRVIDGGSWRYVNKYVLDDTCRFRPGGMTRCMCLFLFPGAILLNKCKTTLIISYVVEHVLVK